MAIRSRVVCWAVAATCSLFLVNSPAQNTSPSNTPTGNTFALVVGISRYPALPGGYQLQFADRDARLFADSIKKAGVSPSNIKLLVGPEATAAAIKAALGSWLARAAYPPDTVYLFFSGHGLVEREFGEAYLLAYDSDPKDAFATAVSLNDIHRAVNRRIRARQVLILADAVKRDLFNPDSDAGESARLFTEAFNTLANSRAGLSVVLASGPNEFSREGQRWGGAGVFTKYVADALAGAADVNADGSVTGNEFFDFVFNHVAEDTSNKQHAWLAASTLAEITLSRSVTKPAIATSAPSQTQPELQQQPQEARAAEPAPPTRSSLPESRTNEARTPATAGNEQLPTPTGTAPAQRNEIPASSAPARPSVASNEPPPSPSASTAAPKGTSARGPATTTSPSRRTSAPPPSRRVPTEARKEASKTAPPRTKAQEVDVDRTAATQPANTEPTPPAAARPPTPKPRISPPAVGTVTTRPVDGEIEPVSGSVPSAGAGRIPSPLVLETAAAISTGALIEPKNACAWDYYQKLVQDPLLASEASRLKPLLAAALLKAGRALVIDDVRADNVSAKVDDFRRAGQVLARLRALTPEGTEGLTLEKLSAAQALIALQFYEEAEKALTQLQPRRLAAVENALGLAYLGNFNEFQAERAFKRAIELDMNLAAPHYNLATLYRNQKKEALGEFERAAAIDSSNVAVQAALADEYFSKEKWGQAADTYRKAIALDPVAETLHTKLGHALYSQGLRDEANKEYLKAKELRGKQ